MRTICPYLVKSLSKKKKKTDIFPGPKGTINPLRTGVHLANGSQPSFWKSCRSLPSSFSPFTSQANWLSFLLVYPNSLWKGHWWFLLAKFSGNYCFIILHLFNKYLLTIICQVLPSKIERQIPIKSYLCSHNKCNLKKCTGCYGTMQQITLFNHGESLDLYSRIWLLWHCTSLTFLLSYWLHFVTFSGWPLYICQGQSWMTQDNSGLCLPSWYNS